LPTLIPAATVMSLSQVISTVAMISQPTAEEDPDYGDTEGWKPNNNQGGERITDCCLAAKILKYNKATILNNCVCAGMSLVTLATKHRCNARKPMYTIGTRKHVEVSKVVSYVLSCLRSESRMDVIASSRRAMHKKQPGRATIAPRSTTEAVERIDKLFIPSTKNLQMSHHTGACTAWFLNQRTELIPWMILQKNNQAMIDAEGML
jgi:hypothetical protein